MSYEYGVVGDVTSDVCLMLALALTLLYLKYTMSRPFNKKNTTKSAARVIRFHSLKIVLSQPWVLTLEDEEETALALGNIGSLIPHDCEVVVTQDMTSLQLEVCDVISLLITHRTVSTCHIYSLTWRLLDETAADSFIDTYKLLHYHWYGIGHCFSQYWPLEKCHGSGAAVTGESGPVLSRYFGGLQERVLFCSSGVALVIDKHTPLFINIGNNNSVEFKVRSTSPYKTRSFPDRQFKYELFQSCDLREVWTHVSEASFKRPQATPCQLIFRHPIWSTWAQYKKNINQEKVLDFAKKIREHEFSCSLLEIDDDWTPHYGDLTFDSRKFPDPGAMITEIKALGFHVSLWVHPFLSLFSRTFQEGRVKRYVVENGYGIPAVYSWWNGYASLIDFTNTQASQWFLAKLHNLVTQYGVDSFKIDAGEAYHLSPTDVTSKPLVSPNQFTKLFAEAAAACDTSLRAQEIRVGSDNQHLPMFFRLQDKDSNWGYFNGIKTVIPHVLTQGLLGYPFVLPDMIGGNAYSILPGSSYPDRELYIRWVQLNALLPAMQFSVVPWLYDLDVVTIAQQMCQLHESYSHKIISLASQSLLTGQPICRPLWWIAPRDPVALTIDSQFLLGDDTLVAPVLDKGARHRDVYLPRGSWRDEGSGVVLEGGRYYREYPAPLNVLLYFERAT